MNKLGVLKSSFAERRLLQQFCQLAAQRSARLVATALVATMEKMQLPLEEGLTVAVDGSVYAQYLNFKGMVQLGLEELLGKERCKKIHLEDQKDASGIGAAVIAAVAANNPT